MNTLIEKQIREKLAELEHEQWMSWARSVMQGENVSEERKKRWESFMVPYSELPENWKEMDRVWADKSLSIIKPILTQYAEKREKEVVICAALKNRDGIIIRGHRHNYCNEILVRMGLPKFNSALDEHGFITSKNRFVDRKEAFRIQHKANIKSHYPGGYDKSGELFSEDLY